MYNVLSVIQFPQRSNTKELSQNSCSCFAHVPHPYDRFGSNALTADRSAQLPNDHTDPKPLTDSPKETIEPKLTDLPNDPAVPKPSTDSPNDPAVPKPQRPHRAQDLDRPTQRPGMLLSRNARPDRF